MRMKQQINLIKDKMGHLVKVIGVCGRVEFLLTYILVFALIALLWLYETRYTRLWDANTHSYLITLLGHNIRLDAYVLYIVNHIGMYDLFLGNLTVSLLVLPFNVASIDSRSELLYLLLYVLLYLMYYIQGFRRCRDMSVRPWRMFIPLYMPIALFLVKGKKVDRED